MERIIINRPYKQKEKDFILWKCVIEFRNKKYMLENKFYDIKDCYIGTTIDPVVCLLMPIALCNNYELFSIHSVDYELHENLVKLPGAWSKFGFEDKYRNVKYNWNYPITHQKYKIENQFKKNISTFTGGLDSFFTTLNNQKHINEWIYIFGFDIPLKNTELFNKVWASLEESKKLFPNIKKIRRVDSNVREVCRGISLEGSEWGFYLFGPAIFSVIHVFHDIKKVYIPSSYDSEMSRRNGSHFFTDKFYSSSCLSIETDGDVNRIEKTRVLCEKLPECLKYLRVCWKNPGNEYNCSRCLKCQRTMFTIDKFKKFHLATSFNQKINPVSYISLPSAINDPMEKPFINELKNYFKIK